MLVVGGVDPPAWLAGEGVEGELRRGQLVALQHHAVVELGPLVGGRVQAHDLDIPGRTPIWEGEIEDHALRVAVVGADAAAAVVEGIAEHDVGPDMAVGGGGHPPHGEEHHVVQDEQLRLVEADGGPQPVEDEVFPGIDQPVSVEVITGRMGQLHAVARVGGQVRAQRDGVSGWLGARLEGEGRDGLGDTIQGEEEGGLGLGAPVPTLDELSVHGDLGCPGGKRSLGEGVEVFGIGVEGDGLDGLVLGREEVFPVDPQGEPRLEVGQRLGGVGPRGGVGPHVEHREVDGPLGQQVGMDRGGRRARRCVLDVDPVRDGAVGVEEVDEPGKGLALEPVGRLLGWSRQRCLHAAFAEVEGVQDLRWVRRAEGSHPDRRLRHRDPLAREPRGDPGAGVGHGTHAAVNARVFRVVHHLDLGHRRDQVGCREVAVDHGLAGDGRHVRDIEEVVVVGVPHQHRSGTSDHLRVGEGLDAFGVWGDLTGGDGQQIRVAEQRGGEDQVVAVSQCDPPHTQRHHLQWTGGRRGVFSGVVPSPAVVACIVSAAFAATVRRASGGRPASVPSRRWLLGTAADGDGPENEER